MRLIDADKFEKDLNELELSPEQAEKVKNLVYDQPTVFAVFSGGRRVGKKAIAEYVNMCYVLDDYGIDSINPAQNLRYETHPVVRPRLEGKQRTLLSSRVGRVCLGAH